MFKADPTALAIETEIWISAAPEHIWSILTGFGAYAAWNPYMIKVEGKPVEGTKLRVHTCDLASGRHFDHSIDVQAAEPYLMHWVGGSADRAAFCGNHLFELVPMSSGETLFLHREYFTGSKAKETIGDHLDAIRANFQAFNESLKLRAQEGRCSP